jgi:hypothetical protein
MNEPRTPEASPNAFDGDAISRADREFLANLGNHPLVRHPLYSVPPRRGRITMGAPQLPKERKRRKRAFRLRLTGCW